MIVKSTRTTWVGSALAFALGGAVLVVPIAGAQDPAESTAPQCETVVTGGSFNWGLKESFRKYIKGPIARGDWTIKGNVTESDPQDQRGKDFYFQYEIDPAKSSIKLDEQGNVTSAKLHTKESQVVFEGHKGALYSNFQSPYIEASGNKIQGGAGYTGYYVEGQSMVDYRPEHRTEENKVTGADVFSEGKGAWKVNGDTVTLNATDMTYVPKKGTDPNKGLVEGVDILFMGMYSEDYKPELDDINLSLTTEQKCTTPEPSATTESTTEKPSESSSTETTSAQPSEKPSESTTTPTTTPSQPSSTPTQTEDPDKKPDKDPNKDQGSSLMTKLGSVWNYVLGGVGILGMFGIIGHALNMAGIFDGLQKQVINFLRQFNLR